MPKLDKKLNEPSILVKPISRFGGLDNIHIALLVLVIILILLLVVMSFNTKITIINATQGENCTYSSMNGTCITPLNTPAQIKLVAERILAGYSSSNTSASLLSYLANVNQANVSYLSNTREWYVSIPYISPVNGKDYTLGIIISDANTSKFSTLVQQLSPPSISKNYVIAPGTIKLSGQTSCISGNIHQVYWFIDPYAPGSIQSLKNATSLEEKFGKEANLSIKVLFTQSSQQVANTYGLNNTLNLAKYILCGSVQSNFTGFVSSLNASYSGTYMPAYILSGIAAQSGFNMSSMNSCVASSQHIINAQAVQAKYYNITSSSAVLTDCEYLSIPETASQALCYASNSTC